MLAGEVTLVLQGKDPGLIRGKSRGVRDQSLGGPPCIFQRRDARQECGIYFRSLDNQGCSGPPRFVLPKSCEGGFRDEQAAAWGRVGGGVVDDFALSCTGSKYRSLDSNLGLSGLQSMLVCLVPAG